MTDIGLTVKKLFAQVQTIGLFGVELALIAGYHQIIGSSLGDFILGQDGLDTMTGGTGNDVLSGGGKGA